MKVFYVVHITDDTLRACIDGIRHLCNPRNKEPAHITVRGPYRQRYNIERLSSLVRGSVVRITGAGCFFDDGQNTVFFHCDAPRLELVWHKPQYPDYNPHITLYDGESRAIAEELLKIVGKYRYNFCFRAEGLRPLVSVKSSGNLSLRYSFDAALVASLIGEHVEASQLHSISPRKRFDLMERICDYLSRLECRAMSDEHEVAAVTAPIGSAPSGPFDGSVEQKIRAGMPRDGSLRHLNEA